MVRPHAEREEGDRDARARDESVAEDRLPAEDRDDFGDHAHRREHHDVDLGVSEEPEEVLPEHRLAAAGRIEEVAAELAIHEEHDERSGERGVRAKDQDTGDEGHPNEQRHARDRHPWAAHEQDRHGEVDRTDDRARAVHGESKDVVVDPAARREGALGQRRVREPSGVGRTAGEEAEVENDPADERQPERKCVEPRERDVRRTDHEWHEVVRKANEERDDREQDHRHAVHGERLIEGLGVEEPLFGSGELRS